ncbi:hypothetical protein BDR07DRAFT_1491060 [Suillus spraguei]|nr:hypothetical protein BDR07DRAFT_1491060 [Suillus spraguei]
MACALGSDGKLKDASAIDWYNDPDNDTPFPAPPPPPASAFVSRRSGRALKLTEKIRKAANTAPAKRLAPAPPPNTPAPPGPYDAKAINPDTGKEEAGHWCKVCRAKGVT